MFISLAAFAGRVSEFISPSIAERRVNAGGVWNSQVHLLRSLARSWQIGLSGLKDRQEKSPYCIIL